MRVTIGFILAWNVLLLPTMMFGQQSGETFGAFVARGTITQFMRNNASGSNFISSSYYEVIFNDNGDYSIKVFSTNPSGQHIIEHCGTDGLDCFLKMNVFSSNSVASPNDPLSGGGSKALTTDAAVNKGGFPSRANEFPQALWLLFVLDRLPSSERTNALSESRELAFFRVNNSLGGIDPQIMETEVTPYSNIDNSIANVRYYNPGYFMSPENKQISFAPPNDHGFIVASLKKDELFYQDAQLPKTALFATYIQDHAISNRDDVPMFTWDKIIVTSCQPTNVDSATLLPQISDGVFIQDYRISQELNGNAVGYLTEGNQWLARNNSRLQKLFNAARAAKLAQKGQNYLPRSLVMSVLFATLIVPIGFFFIKGSRRTPKQGTLNQ